MSTKKKTARAKGFTLIELIVVIGIIGVLLLVAIPTISSYMRRSRLKSSNANAKLIFNSIQTICQELEFAERDDPVTTFYGSEPMLDGTGNPVKKNGKDVMLGITDGHMIVYSIDGVATATVWQDTDHDGTVDTAESATFNTALTNTLNDDSTRSSFMNRMERLFAGQNETSWVAYINGFQVMAVICADTNTNRYVGAYPINTTDVFGEVTEAAGLDDMNNINAFMSDPNFFTNFRTAFVDPAWD
ncbi:MAG: type II secretion system protein [Oscillospiraceae bacterium]